MLTSFKITKMKRIKYFFKKYFANFQKITPIIVKEKKTHLIKLENTLEVCCIYFITNLIRTSSSARFIESLWHVLINIYRLWYVTYRIKFLIEDCLEIPQQK